MLTLRKEGARKAPRRILMDVRFTQLPLALGTGFVVHHGRRHHRDGLDEWSPGWRLLSRDDLARILAIWKACQEE